MQLEIRNLAKLYDHKRGLAPTSFTVNRGELIAIVGHNGAGKSTLLKILANWIIPDGGSALMNGIDLRNRTAVAKNVGFIPEVPNLFDVFSVEYNLKLFAALSRTPFLRVEEILGEFNLLPFRKTRVQSLSKGLKQRVNIGRALLADPALLILDEPTSGLDFEMTKEIHRLLNTMHAAGKTILFTSHRPEEIKSLATRIMVLHEGSLIFDGSPAEYFRSETHEKLYA
ncbi:MAG: bacitracin ABC transporter ATP-binding protein [Zetaproteobacteria bacterium CG12_big_fil_rev_8_21_14_0_65_54_13]|nr:MAG: bacitracin ABC transporter ATP-binding protein [Zetaproteobacteria bacterium CG12_big_fil_rev_8_21_14_0_65_54_13]PIX54490.1 MAG: bacitracin ABC transporter ATP-binding protein [Zetaproteobacteria bacterium CG_4_10_14_3_um_filter_54_28]PJA28662.1 MAG: bacitracin ABC transporter ATP-binding protein [Zetaproteobacteria bacterium CG_4_9_14_3_um_filter_54_145]